MSRSEFPLGGWFKLSNHRSLTVVVVLLTWI